MCMYSIRTSQTPKFIFLVLPAFCLVYFFVVCAYICDVKLRVLICPKGSAWSPFSPRGGSSWLVLGCSSGTGVSRKQIKPGPEDLASSHLWVSGILLTSSAVLELGDGTQRCGSWAGLGCWAGLPTLEKAGLVPHDVSCRWRLRVDTSRIRHVRTASHAQVGRVHVLGAERNIPGASEHDTCVVPLILIAFKETGTHALLTLWLMRGHLQTQSPARNPRRAGSGAPPTGLFTVLPLLGSRPVCIVPGCFERLSTLKEAPIVIACARA